MTKTFSVRGYLKKSGSPIFIEEELPSMEEARAKAEERWNELKNLYQIIIFEEEEGAVKGATKSFIRKEDGEYEEVDGWWEDEV